MSDATFFLYSGISIKRTPLVQKKCPLFRDVRFTEIFDRKIKGIHSLSYCRSYRGVRFIVCPLYRDSTVYVLQIFLYFTVEILSHQQSPDVVYQGFFVTKFKIREIDHIPGDYLVTLFTLGRFIAWGNPSYWRLLKNENSIIAIFTKSIWYCPCFNQIIPSSSIGTC